MEKETGHHLIRDSKCQNKTNAFLQEEDEEVDDLLVSWPTLEDDIRKQDLEKEDEDDDGLLECWPSAIDDNTDVNFENDSHNVTKVAHDSINSNRRSTPVDVNQSKFGRARFNMRLFGSFLIRIRSSVIPTTKKRAKDSVQDQEGGGNSSTSDTVSVSEDISDSNHRLENLNGVQDQSLITHSSYTHQNSVKTQEGESFGLRKNIGNWFQKRFSSMTKRFKKKTQIISNEEDCHFTPWPTAEEMNRLSDDEADLDSVSEGTRQMESPSCREISSDYIYPNDGICDNEGRDLNSVDKNSDDSYSCGSDSQEDDGFYSQDPRLYPIQEEDDSTNENLETNPL